MGFLGMIEQFFSLCMELGVSYSTNGKFVTCTGSKISHCKYPGMKLGNWDACKLHAGPQLKFLQHSSHGIAYTFFLQDSQTILALNPSYKLKSYCRKNLPLTSTNLLLFALLPSMKLNSRSVNLSSVMSTSCTPCNFLLVFLIVRHTTVVIQLTTVNSW